MRDLVRVVAIDALKSRVPIWKKELCADGSAWLEGPGNDPELRHGLSSPCAGGVGKSMDSQVFSG